MPEPLLETWAARGIVIVQGYGLTEAAPNVLCLPPEDAVRKTRLRRQAVPVRRRRLSDEDELLVRGPNVFPGYWRNAEATAARVHRRTAGSAPATSPSATSEGFYRIKGRLKDMYISGGENVYPAEIETVLHEHPRDRRRRRRRRARRALGRGRRRVRRRRRRHRGGGARRGAASASRASRCRRPCASSSAIPRNGLGQGAEAGAAGGGGDVSDRHRRRRARAVAEGGRDAPAPARRGRERVRRARLLRCVDREDHRGGRRRAGHVLPLLRVEEGDLRRARARPEPPHPPRDDGVGGEGEDAARGRSCSASAATSSSPRSIRGCTGSSGRSAFVSPDVFQLPLRARVRAATSPALREAVDRRRGSAPSIPR